MSCGEQERECWQTGETTRWERFCFEEGKNQGAFLNIDTVRKLFDEGEEEAAALRQPSRLPGITGEVDTDNVLAKPFEIEDVLSLATR